MTPTPKTLPAPSFPYSAGLHYFAIFLTLWTFWVVVLGGAVKSNEAGLSIPEAFILEWLPNWWERPNLRLEFAHRAVVGILGLGVFALMLISFISGQRGSIKRFSVYLMFAVIVQAVFGYMTVRFFAHWHTSIPHVMLGHAFLGMMACFTTMLSPSWVGGTPKQVETEQPSLQRLVRANMIMAFVQLILGAAIRHDDRGKALQNNNDWVFYTHLGLHVVGALGVGYFLSKVLTRVLHHHRDQPEIMRPAKFMMMLYGLQFLLGPAAAMLKVMYSRDSLDADGPPLIRAWVATSHVVAGAIILSLSAVMYARTKRFVATITPANAIANAAVTGVPA